MTHCIYCNNTDYSSTSIGECEEGFRLMFTSGIDKTPRIELEKWHEKHGWQIIGIYYPQYCPICGMELIEANTYKKLEERIKCDFSIFKENNDIIQYTINSITTCQLLESAHFQDKINKEEYLKLATLHNTLLNKVHKEQILNKNFKL